MSGCMYVYMHACTHTYTIWLNHDSTNCSLGVHPPNLAQAPRPRAPSFLLSGGNSLSAPTHAAEMYRPKQVLISFRGTFEVCETLARTGRWDSDIGNS